MEDQIQKLKYRLIETTSEDPDYPLYELLRGADSTGWMSVRFCTYPQEILLQFIYPVNLRQINILCNEKKIPSLIELYSYYPSNPDEMYNNYKHFTFDKLGYIRMDSNSKTNYKAREYRKIYMNTPCCYLKLTLHKNFVNKYNVFNQIGLIGLEFLGTVIHINKNQLYLQESIKNNLNEIKEEDLDDISQEKIRLIKKEMDEALKKEDYDEAKKLKKNMERIRIIGKKIHELEIMKKLYINNEDFDNAKIMKLEIERLKTNLKHMDKQLANIVPYSSVSLEINKTSNGDEIIPEVNEENKDGSLTNIKETINKDVSFSTNHDVTNIVDKSVLNKSNHSLEKIIEEEFLPYDDQVLFHFKIR